MITIEFGKDRYHLINAMVGWCHEHFGNGGWLAHPDDRWAIKTAFGNSFFQFKHEEDATMFALRWK